MRFFVFGGRVGAPLNADEWQRRSPAKVEMPGMWDGKLGFLEGKISSASRSRRCDSLRVEVDVNLLDLPRIFLVATVLTQNDL